MREVQEREGIVYGQLRWIREVLLSANMLVRDTLVQELEVATKNNRVLIQEISDSFNCICFRSLKLCLLSDVNVYSSSMICTISSEGFLILSLLLPSYIRLNVLDINSWLKTTTFSVTVDLSSIETTDTEEEDVSYYLYSYIKLFKCMKRMSEMYFISKVYETDINSDMKNICKIINNLVLDCLFKVEFGKATFRHTGILTTEDKVLLCKTFGIQVVGDNQGYTLAF